MSGHLERLQRLLLANHYLLLAVMLTLLWQALPGGGLGRALIAVLLILPLTAPLPGLWRASRRAIVWSCLLAAPYAAVAMMEAIARPPARPLALAAIGSILVAVWLSFSYLRLARTSRFR